MPSLPTSSLVFLLLAAAGAAQTVEGTVVDAVTGRGVANITAIIQQLGDPPLRATTDAQGHFVIENVKPGTYSVHYASMDYPPWGETNQKFQVTAGDPVKLSARLTPFATVSGRVVDSRGDPIPEAEVNLTSPGHSSSDRTNRQGKFEFHFGLGAGTYALSALPPRGWKPPDPDSASGQKRGWIRTYYPGVTVPEGALKIVVAPGGQVHDLELKVLPAPVHMLHGVLLTPEGKPAPKVQVDVGEGKSAITASVESAADGSFEFALVDGEWQMDASIDRGEQHQQVRQWVEMAGHDLEGLKLRLAEPFEVHGKIVVEAPQGTLLPKLPAIGLAPQESRLYRDNYPITGPMLGGFARPDAAGNFTARNLYPNVYWVTVTAAPPGYFLDSIRMGERELPPGGVEIASGDLALTAVYKSNGGSLRGEAEKCASGGVLLVPADPAMRRPGFFAMADCDDQDRYQFSALRPGDYYALEFPGNGPTPFYAATPSESLLKQAVRVTIRAGETSIADLRPATQ